MSFELTHIPSEIIEEEVTKWLDYKTKHIMATVCSRFGTIWKSWVDVLPGCVMLECDDDRLSSFYSLRELQLWGNAKITNKGLEQLHKLEQLDVGNALVDPSTNAVITKWNIPTTYVGLKVRRVHHYLNSILSQQSKDGKCSILVELLAYLAKPEVAKALRNKNFYKTIIEKINEQEPHLEGKAADTISKIRELYRYDE
jgi:hypothetical protein